MQTYEPFSQIYPGLKVWKTGRCYDDASTGQLHILQTFYAEDACGRVESFAHELCLQRYTREEWIKAFDECGFDLKREYVDHDWNEWRGGDESARLFELVRR